MRSLSISARSYFIHAGMSLNASLATSVSGSNLTSEHV